MDEPAALVPVVILGHQPPRDPAIGGWRVTPSPWPSPTAVRAPATADAIQAMVPGGTGRTLGEVAWVLGACAMGEAAIGAQETPTSLPHPGEEAGMTGADRARAGGRKPSHGDGRTTGRPDVRYHGAVSMPP